jgi:hypothetical protein
MNEGWLESRISLSKLVKKVVCVDNITHNGMKYNITIGKVYQVYEINSWEYIIDDNRMDDHYIPYLYQPLEKFRKKRINDFLK